MGKFNHLSHTLFTIKPTKDIEIKEALDFFWLSIPVKNRNEIKKTYKKLSMIHHPDRWWKNSDFIKLTKYKKILEKNFYLINKRNVDLENEIEELEKEEVNNNNNNNNNSPKILLEIKIRKFKLSIFYLIDLILIYFILSISYVVWIIFIICIYWILFIIPISFFDKNIEIFEPNFKEEMYITNWINIWHYDNGDIRDLWEYDDEFKNHNIKIEPYEKLEEKRKLVIQLTLKIISSYLVILLLFSLIYYLFIKKFILKFIDYITKKIDTKFWNYRIKYNKFIFECDCKFREIRFYQKILYLIKISKIGLIVKSVWLRWLNFPI